MFEHAFHQKILDVLQSLNADIFAEAGAYFGGGTLLTLLNDEYRWSKDIDFICAVGAGYKQLRSRVVDAGYNPRIFFTATEQLDFPREMTVNQYGIRFLVVAEGVPVKFEIVAEGRITLNPPVFLPWLRVPCLDEQDRYTEKLLANADRWYDAAVESRDLIDLAVMRTQGEIPLAAINKAEQAYEVVPSLIKALEKFQQNSAYRDKCFMALQIQNRAKIIDGVDLLAQDYGMGLTERQAEEL